MEQLKGFKLEHKVYKLHKALYELKQAFRVWYSKIDSYFVDNNFYENASEPTLYVKTYENEFLVVCLYVDDMIYIENSVEIMKVFKESIIRTFDMFILGLLHYFLGIQVMQYENGIFICQRKYGTNLLKLIGISNCKAAKTSFNTNDKLSLNDGVEKTDEKHFRSMVGGLMYLTHT